MDLHESEPQDKVPSPPDSPPTISSNQRLGKQPTWRLGLIALAAILVIAAIIAGRMHAVVPKSQLTTPASPFYAMTYIPLPNGRSSAFGAFNSRTGQQIWQVSQSTYGEPLGYQQGIFFLDYPNQRMTEGVLASDGQVAWKHQTNWIAPVQGTTQVFPPLDGAVLVYEIPSTTNPVSLNAQVALYDIVKGTARWTFPVHGLTSDQMRLEIRAIGTTVYISQPLSTTTSQIIALDARTGMRLWSTPMAMEYPLLLGASAQTALFTPIGQDQIVALSATTGQVSWSATPRPGNARLALFDDHSNADIINQSGTSTAYALTDGHVVWTHPAVTSEGIQSANLAAQLNGDQLNISFDTAFITINSGDGTLRWQAPPTVIVHAGGYYLSQGKSLIALQATSGKPLWTFNGDGPLTVDPFTPTDGALLVYSTSSIYALNTQNGTLRWKFKATARGLVSTTPVVTEGHFVTWSVGPYNTNYVYVLNESTGKLIWQQTFKGSMVAMGAGTDFNTLYGSLYPA